MNNILSKIKKFFFYKKKISLYKISSGIYAGSRRWIYSPLMSECGMESEYRKYDLPAIFYFGGHKAWCKNGNLHRLNNKPAVIRFDGKKEYWVNGKYKYAKYE